MLLVDKKRAKDSKANLKVLLKHLSGVVEERHKALVCSQFTTLFDFVGNRLTQAGMPYEYFDGKMTDRLAPVERFQNDPAARLFLISLTAGGVGLN